MAASESSGTTERPLLSHRETLLIVFGVLLPLFLGSVSQTIVASALPTIGLALGGSNDLSWIITAYLLTSTAATPLFGKFSDIFGRRVSMQLALWVFIGGSVACALAPNIPMLVLARGIQGIAAGGLTSVPMTVLGDLAPPKERVRYYTYFSLTHITAGALGPVLGGFFAQYLHWSAIFWFGVPLGLLGVAITQRLLKKLPSNHRYHKLDFAGAALIVAASTSFMFMLNAGGRIYPWNSAQIFALAGLSFVLWAAFIWRLRTAAEPLIPLDIIGNRVVRMAILCNSFGWGAMIGLNIYLPIWLQTVSRMSPAQSGLALMVVMFAVNLGALGGAQVTARVTHYKRLPMIALALSMSASLWLAWHSGGMGFVELQIVLAILGLSFGPVAPTTTVCLQNAVPLHQMGTAVGSMAFGRGLFTTILVAAFGVIVLHAMPAGGVPASAAEQDVLVMAFRTLFVVAALCQGLSLLFLHLMDEVPLRSGRD
ncbi:MAG: arabinose efflux permease family protein [Hyphomicrobiales bacterium]|nr:arabinose efflux permease family protein [Hyphomicrobiales bacterium]